MRLDCAFLILGVSIFFGVAQAAETIETDSMSISLPAGWKSNVSSAPISATGPKGEFIQFSPKTVTGIKSPEETNRILEDVEKNAATAIANGAADPDLVTVSPLERRRLSSGTTIQEHVSRTKNVKQVFAQFSVRGPRSLVFITYEAPMNNETLRQVRESLERIKWK